MASVQRPAGTEPRRRGTWRSAIEAAERGWAVFPCRPGDKRPAVNRWEERACADPRRVARYWPSGRHNVGIACGPSSLVVIDLDTAAHGGQVPGEWRAEPGVVDGAGVLAILAKRAGQPLPRTHTVRTPSGGTHLYFQAPVGGEIRNSASKIGPMVDVRGRGGYIIGAGSHVGRLAYEVLDQGEPVPLPSWLADLADPPWLDRPVQSTQVPGELYPRLRGIVETVLSAEPGTRNGRLFWAACRAREMVVAGQVDRGTAERVLLDAALEAGLRGGEREARRTIGSGLGPA